MTFLPEDESENTQIEGRTCRQDDPGSVRKILFAEELEKALKVANIENAKAKSGKNWDTFLLDLRNEHQVLLRSWASAELLCVNRVREISVGLPDQRRLPIF